MHISNAQIQKVFELHMHKVRALDIRFADPVSSPDQLSLSRQATEMQHIKQYISGLPDVRHEKVRDLRGTIQEETYQVSNYDLASAMFASAGQIRTGG